MKVIVVALAFVTVAVAAAIDGAPSEILRFDNVQDPDGTFKYAFETSDGTQVEEQGELKTVQNEENKPQEVVVVRGSWTYVDPEGNVQTMQYIADETGFHADGPSVPKAVSRR